MRSLQVLNLPRGGPVTVGMNVPSTSFGRKDIIRVEGVELSKGELDRLALLGQRVTVSLVRDGDVAHKVVLETPAPGRRASCTAPIRRASRTHEAVPTVFHRIGEFPYRFRCHYCERTRSIHEEPQTALANRP